MAVKDVPNSSASMGSPGDKTGPETPTTMIPAKRVRKNSSFLQRGKFYINADLTRVTKGSFGLELG